jgi:hypothetical protein
MIMADEVKTELTPEQKLEQEQAAKTASEKAPDDKSKKPDSEKTVSEKQFKELQAGFTKASQENAELRKTNNEILERLKNVSTVLSPQETKEVAKDEDALRKGLYDEINYCKERNISTANQEATLLILDERRQERLNNQAMQKGMDDFAEFTEKRKDEIEHPKCPYSMKELTTIQTREIKAGRNINLDIARSIWIAENQDKYVKAITEMKEKADSARGQDGTGTSPDGKGGKSVAKERWDAQFKSK